MSKIFPGISSNSSDSNTRSRFEEYSDRSSSGSNTQSNQINESFSGLVVSFSVYKLLSEIIKPFNSLNAFKVGAIDSEGNYVTDIENMTPQQKAALTPFNRMVIGIKRLIRTTSSSKLRAEYSYLSTAAKAMAFECAQMGGSSDLFLEEIQKCIDVLIEDGEMPGNFSGGAFLNPQVGEGQINNAIAGYSAPLGLIKRKKKDIKDVIIKP
jgi:hypothetical protein